MLVTLVLVTSPPTAARAEDAAVGEGRAAMPGLVHARIAEERPRGFAVRASVGYGLTESIGRAPGVHHRGTMRLGVSGQPLRWLGVGLALDARADAHPNDFTPGVGGREAHGAVEVRATPYVGRGFTVGGAAMAVFHGRFGGGLAADATSLELVGIGSYRHAHLLLTGEVGYRVDRSERVVRGQVFDPSDRLSLGISSFDAVLLRLSAVRALGSRDVFVDYALDALVGRGAPSFTRSPMRLAFGLRQRFGTSMALDGYVDFAVSARPALPVADPYVRIDPRFEFGASFSYRFVGRANAVTAAEHDSEHDVDDEAARTSAEAEAQARAEEEARAAAEAQARAAASAPRSLDGVVRDANGEPVVDAHVVVSVAGGNSLDAYTDARGRFVVEGIPPGEAELRIEAVGLETQTMELGAGRLALPMEGIRLVPAAASGLLRGTVLGFEDEPVRAVITITPGDRSATVDAEGRFEIALEPGVYRLRIEASGYAAQTREVRLANATVTILHVEMRTRR